MEGWKDCRLFCQNRGGRGREKGWMNGSVEEWKGGRMEGLSSILSESRRTRKGKGMDEWKCGRVEGRKDGRTVVYFVRIAEDAENTEDAEGVSCVFKFTFTYWG